MVISTQTRLKASGPYSSGLGMGRIAITRLDIRLCMWLKGVMSTITDIEPNIFWKFLRESILC